MRLACKKRPAERAGACMVCNTRTGGRARHYIRSLMPASRLTPAIVGKGPDALVSSGMRSPVAGQRQSTRMRSTARKSHRVRQRPADAPWPASAFARIRLWIDEFDRARCRRARGWPTRRTGGLRSICARRTFSAELRRRKKEKESGLEQEVPAGGCIRTLRASSRDASPCGRTARAP